MITNNQALDSELVDNLNVNLSQGMYLPFEVCGNGVEDGSCIDPTLEPYPDGPEISPYGY